MLAVIMRVVLCVLLVVAFSFLSCSQEGVGRRVASYSAVACCRERIPVVLLFSFVESVGDNVMLGPVRVVGAEEEMVFCSLLAPYVSSLYGYTMLRPGASDERVVPMYASASGFSRLHPACWRFCMLSARLDADNELLLEVNYSYEFENASGRGIVEGVERLPLCGIPDVPLIRFSNADMPFTVVCVFVDYFNTCCI